jgi:hypothetical protein
MSENVFAPPRANLETREGPEALWDMTFKQVRKLYLASVNVRALGVIYALGALGLISASTFMFADVDPNVRAAIPAGLTAFYVGIGIVFVAGTVTSYMRPRWGRWLGIVLCVLMLFNIPLGTAIGIIGLIAYAQGGKLFGRDRLLHTDVAAVYKQRKKDKQ